MQTATTTNPAATQSIAPARSNLLQRKCDCGKSSGLSGQCSECEQKKLLQRRANDPSEVTEVPPIVYEVLRSPGQPLDMETRLQMESRFNQDFAPVRIHTNAHASQSAAALDAQAYTHAEQIVFDAGRYAPHTPKGTLLLAHELTHVLQQRSQPEVSPQSQTLQVGAANDTLEQEADRIADQVMRLPAVDRLAHELTHVVQQSAGAHPIQRWANCKPARLSLQDCPPREPAETQRARNGPMVFLPSLKVPTTGDEGVLIVNFDIGSAAIKRNLHEMLYWQQFLQTIAANRSQWRLLGFTDCQGSESRNQKLRQERATAVFNILPPAIKPQIVLHQGAPIQDCLTENNTAADRTLNRSVALILETSFADMEAEEVSACIPPTAQSSPGKRCKFYVYDSEEPTFIPGKAWKAGAYAFAASRPGAYVIASGKRIEDMLKTMLDTYAAKGCGCTDEIQFWSHGSPGNGMSITGDGEFTANSFKIAGLEKFGDGPTSMPGYRQWADKLSVEQRRLVLLRRTICGPDSEVYYRSCQAFQKKEGQEFAKASAQFWRSEVVGHTKLIALTQPGKKTLKPCQEPYWSQTEGEQEEGKKGKDDLRNIKPR